MKYWFVLLIFGSCIFGIAIMYWLNLKPENIDGLDIWRSPLDKYSVEVIYEGEKYYCEHAESLAGHPDKLVLYRGEHSYLMLPFKYAITDTSQKKIK